MKVQHNRQAFKGLFTLLTVLLLTTCAEPTIADVRLERANNILDSLINNSSLPAISVGLTSKGKVFELHHGQLLNGKSPSSSTLFEIASLTKTFTGTLLAHAIVDEKAKIDQDIRLHLTDSFPNLAYEGSPITFRHLVTHQSGLPRFFPDTPGLFDNPDWDNLPDKIIDLQVGFLRKDFFNSLKQVELDTLPGTQFIYSNAGANLLGYLLENIYEQPFEELLQEKILDPLEMKSTTIHLQALDFEQLAHGQNTGGKRMPFRPEKGMMAEGGLFSSTSDMVKYMQYHLNSSQAVIQTAQQELWEGQFGDYEAGLFWQIFKDGDKPDQVYQNGGAFGTSSWMTLIPELQLGIFLVTNTAGEGVHQQLNQVADEILAIFQEEELGE